MNQRGREREMIATWESFRPWMKRKLQELDHMTRQIEYEMRSVGASSKMIYEFLPKAFAELWREVAREENEKHERKERSA